MRSAAKSKERFRCQNADRWGRTFLREYTYPGRLPQVKRQIVAMTLKGSGVRDIARVLQSSPNTVIEELKNRPPLSPPSTKLLWRGAAPRRSR